jgi:hypothetical protein
LANATLLEKINGIQILSGSTQFGILNKLFKHQIMEQGLNYQLLGK